LPIGLFDASKKTRIKSDLAYFSDAYRSIKNGDYAAAKATFDEAATFYDLAMFDVAYMLPYYALAAAKAGDSSAVEKILGRFGPIDRQFDYYLAKAAIAGLSGNVEDSVQSLNLARYRRPNTWARPLLTQYTYGEFCEMLAELMKNSKVREIALDWARKNQKNEPWQSWSYALEAKLSTNAADRGRALAMAHYLDPNSERLAAIKKSEVDAAVKAYSSLNPFRMKPSQPVKRDAA
jgi:hypothetical protein